MSISMLFFAQVPPPCLFPSNMFKALHLGLKQVLSFPDLLTEIPALTQQETLCYTVLTVKCCWAGFTGHGRVPCKGVVGILHVKRRSLRVVFLIHEYFKNIKRFHFLYPQVTHQTQVWPHLPLCRLPLGGGEPGGKEPSQST